jgi:enoyl-[acyl-carrier protein] reductase/trans-2-enoyl-CoA reductase (NAD+)
MRLALPEFQYRFMPAAGHVIFPGNFHPVGVQRDAEAMVERLAAARPQAAAGAGGRWLLVGGSGGFGSGARASLIQRGAHTIDVSFDAAPNPESNNKIRKLGSPGWHRATALERVARARGLVACSSPGDAFSPAVRAATIATVREQLAGAAGGDGTAKLDGLVWSLAAPRATDPRSGRPVASALRPLGKPATIKTFSGPDPAAGVPAKVVEVTFEPGSPAEAIATVFVMGGRVVEAWIEALLAADLLAEGFTLVTISYRGNPLNEPIYHKGMIGLAKADLEFTTAALDAVLRERVGGRAVAALGPAVVTEASGGIPGVPFYLAHLLPLLGERFEDPLASMDRMFELLGHADARDGEGLLRLDDRELAPAVQASLAATFAAAEVGDEVDAARVAGFMAAYARTRGFGVEGVDTTAEFDVDAITAVAP